jgi:protein translocase SecG subunit
MNFLIGFIIFVHIVTSVLLVLIVLMQRPRSEGLGTAFGGGVTDNLFGASAGNVLVKITTWLGIIFFTTTLSLAFIYSHRNTAGSSTILEKLKQTPSAAAATNAVPFNVMTTNSAAVTPAVPPAAPLPKPEGATEKSPAKPVEKSSAPSR